jgi:glycosyltransferase involved in cell wall biosynthesis
VKVLYTGALFDSSGYAEASRNYLSALIDNPEIDLTAQAVSFESWKTDVGPFKDKVTPFLTKSFNDPDIHIVHLTPENYSRLRRPGVKTIGMTVWETDRIPDSWVPLCNHMDEIWVPCDWNKTAFESSGVTVPVKKLPHCINPKEFINVENTKEISDQINSNCFNFYSIFQWSNRKNPEGLIRAYLSEFNADEKVCLVLKTYILNNTEQDKLQTIECIKQIKRDLQLTETAPILLIHGGLSRNEILTIHNCCDCFVLPHRAEGWGVPHFEALAMGKPVIATGYGGNLEFMQLANSWLLSFNLTPVSGMNRPNYHGKMHWAEPNLQNLQYCMRDAFNNRNLVSSKGAAGKLKIEQFNYEEINKRFLELLKVKT